MCDEKKIIEDVKESVEELDKAAEEAVEKAADAVGEAVDQTADALEEPINNIEKTVGDLKKKIEEITEKKDEETGEEKKFTIPDFSLNDDQKERIAEIKENAAEKFDAVKDKVTDKVTEIRENVDVDRGKVWRDGFLDLKNTVRTFLYSCIFMASHHSKHRTAKTGPLLGFGNGDVYTQDVTHDLLPQL